ncbi:hypothetical protein MmTuc01_0816 [Methanosarcina mazei Tuc01]|uniref:Uncharacterized protein n=1 Tax=Methanosarcina mazei Tuc01 TaxID=1236903 RepID=M1P723_METMZ|nr:hypothetical protein MmTuc01_0816 [Methanosarcina mazei Tuc01]
MRIEIKEFEKRMKLQGVIFEYTPHFYHNLAETLGIIKKARRKI